METRLPILLSRRFFARQLALLAISFLPLAFAHAQVKCGLSPALVMANFKPGEPFEVTLEMSNGGNAPMFMRGFAMDYWYDDENKKVFAPAGTLPHSAATWIEFVPRTTIVPAQGSNRIKMIITPPKDAVGSFYAVAFLESKPELTEPASAGKQAVFTNIRLGSLVLLASENSQRYSAAVSDIQIRPPNSNHALEMDFAVQNDSNTHIFPVSALVVMDSSRHVVAKAQGETKRFLPGQKDRLSITWSGALSPGSYTALLSMVYGDSQTYTKELPFVVADGARLASAAETAESIPKASAATPPK